MYSWNTVSDVVFFWKSLSLRLLCSSNQSIMNRGDVETSLLLKEKCTSGLNWNANADTMQVVLGVCCPEQKAVLYSSERFESELRKMSVMTEKRYENWIKSTMRGIKKSLNKTEFGNNTYMVVPAQTGKDLVRLQILFKPDFPCDSKVHHHICSEVTTFV